MSVLVSEQAKRLKRIRLYLGMTREEFAAVSASSPFTIRSWENGQKRLGDKAVKKIINELAKIRFTCTYDWMMHGQGISPISLFEVSTEITASPVLSVHDSAAQPPLLDEIYALKNAYPDISIINVADHSYQPIARPGDFIGIRHLARDNLRSCLDSMVIYTMHTGLQAVGLIKMKGQVMLYSLDQSFVIPLHEVQSLHEVLWYRKS